MKVGIGLYRHMLNEDHFNFAKQCGCSHAVVHLVDYFNQGHQPDKADQPIGDGRGWGYAGNSKKMWETDELLRLKKQINRAGLEWEAIENFDPADWHDILLDGPAKKRQTEEIKRLIRNVGKAGVPIIGYNFSIAGVCSRITGHFARGHALSVGMNGTDERPVPNGMAWNMIYNPKRPPAQLKISLMKPCGNVSKISCTKLFPWRKRPALSWPRIPMIRLCLWCAIRRDWFINPKCTDDC